MRQCMDVPNIQLRIKKIQGQLNAISKMVEEDVPCEDILIQINAAKSAMHKVGKVVLEGHLHHCVKDGIEHGDAEKTIEPEIVEEEKLPTVEDNLRNIAKIVEEEQDQLKIIEERTGEFKLDFGQKKSEEQNSLIDEIDDNMSLDELMSLYEKKFKD